MEIFKFLITGLFMPTHPPPVIKLNLGRLEFVSGGWSMHDEGVTHYNSIIDQHSLGAQFLRNEFGECGRTKLGWEIDPFGHSKEVASLFAHVNLFYFFNIKSQIHFLDGI